MGVSRQEYWSGQPFPSPKDLPDPGIKPASPILQEDSLPTEPSGKSGTQKTTTTTTSDKIIGTMTTNEQKERCQKQT